MPERDATAVQLAAAVLEKNRRAAGRAITLIENGGPAVEILMRGLYAHTGHAYSVGLTGPPGAGKSTVADELIAVIRSQDLRIGIVAVDPNSPFSGGAILGDRIRMMRHSADDGVFIRSMGARGHLGGLAVAAWNTMLLLDAMGTDIVLAETVGVGQSELEVAGAADTTVVVIPPGMGDGVQAIKAGIMEVADIFVVNKADHPRAEQTVADIRELQRMDLEHPEWTPPIVQTVATRGEGIHDLWTRIEQHRQYLERSGGLQLRRRARVEREVTQIAERRLREQVLLPRIHDDGFRGLIDDVVQRHLNPYEVADRIVPTAQSIAGR